MTTALPANVRFTAIAATIRALIERRAAEAIGEIRDMAQLARLEHGMEFGRFGKALNGRTLDGRTHDAFPA